MLLLCLCGGMAGAPRVAARGRSLRVGKRSKRRGRRRRGVGDTTDRAPAGLGARIKHQACPRRDTRRWRCMAVWHACWVSERYRRYVTFRVTRGLMPPFSDEKFAPHQRRDAAREAPPTGCFKQIKTTTRACKKCVWTGSSVLAWTLHIQAARPAQGATRRAQLQHRQQEAHHESHRSRRRNCRCHRL